MAARFGEQAVERLLRLFSWIRPIGTVDPKELGECVSGSVLPVLGKEEVDLAGALVLCRARIGRQKVVERGCRACGLALARSWCRQADLALACHHFSRRFLRAAER